MRRSLILFALGVLLTACATARSTAGSGQAARATSAAQTAAAAPALPTAAPAPSTSTPAAITPTTADPTPTPAEQPPAVTQTAASDNASTGSELSVVSSQIFSMSNGYYIIGEVQNNTATPMQAVQVNAIYEYKPNGKPVFTIGTEQTSTLLDVVPPHGKAPFKLGPYLFGWPVTLYELKVQGQAASLPRQDLILQSSNAYAGGSWLYVRGEIRNTGTSDAHFVKAVVTLYDPKGSVVGVMAAYANPESISAGGYSTFQVSTNYWPNYDHFAVGVQAQ